MDRLQIDVRKLDVFFNEAIQIIEHTEAKEKGRNVSTDWLFQLKGDIAGCHCDIGHGIDQVCAFFRGLQAAGAIETADYDEMSQVALRYLRSL